ncbi:MAG: glycosyltransferase [Rhodospirillales bacterium]|nr:glycosyltransferase [Rhodospirillales bacterium]
MREDELERDLGPPESATVAWRCFDHVWYLLAYPDVAEQVAQDGFESVRAFYLDHGRQLGHSPNMFFDETWYRRRYPTVESAVAAGDLASAYMHYCGPGMAEYAPHWLYDDVTYRLCSPDLTDDVLVRFACANRYDHYLKSGAWERRTAHLLFDPEAYLTGLATQPEGASPFAHYLWNSWRRRADDRTSIYFDAAFYLAANPDAAEAVRRGEQVNALHHYLLSQSGPPRDPCGAFSESFYRDRNPDVLAAIRASQVASGYDHFLKSGVFELRAPAPGIDLRAFLAAHPKVAAAIAAGAQRDAFAAVLRDPPPPPAPGLAPEPLAPAARDGRVDIFGHHAAAAGWLFCGWLAPDDAALAGTAHARARFERGTLEGETLLARFPRDDLQGRGIGVVLHLAAPGRDIGALVGVDIEAGGLSWTALPGEDARPHRDEDLAARLRPVVATLMPGPDRACLAALAARRGFSGHSTLSELDERIFLEIDEVIACPPGGLVLVGWMLAAPGVVRAIRLHGGGETIELDPAQFLRIDRPDVVETVGAPLGLTEPGCGFVAYIPAAGGPAPYLAVETASGEIGFRGLPPARLRGMAAIRFLLERFEARYATLAPVFDNVIGPAVASLNAARLAAPPGIEVIAFGAAPEAPVMSLVVTLFGRIDFMEYQLAFLSRRQGGAPYELIYVLDDPTRRRDAEALAASCLARFGVPFRLAMLAENRGYAPANNVGVGLARGAYVCLLNSDVFPRMSQAMPAGSDDWMERLTARLRADPTLGAVGPLLLFEDGTVQHQGMHFEPLEAFGGWMFPMHARKGWLPPDGHGLLPAAAITGACMVLERRLYEELGGLDEGFIIGDFEDSDLCLRLGARGLACAVDLDVTLHHLERQSQAGSAQNWRMNLTLYNAWRHERRWGASLAAARAAPVHAEAVAAEQRQAEETGARPTKAGDNKIAPATAPRARTRRSA